MTWEKLIEKGVVACDFYKFIEVVILEKKVKLPDTSLAMDSDVRSIGLVNNLITKNSAPLNEGYSTL